MHINIAWQDVDTVLLDMDGTLLDLAFDNYFWQKLVPETYGAKQGISPQEAQDYIRQQYHAVQHTLNWYCLDYWSECLDLDICAMTTEQGPRAVLREDTVPFLDALKASGAEKTLFIDDSEPILDAAALYGIRYCLGVTNPDSGIAEKQYARHPSLNDYRRLIPSLM